MTGPLRRVEKAAADVRAGVNTGVVLGALALGVAIIALVLAVRR